MYDHDHEHHDYVSVCATGSIRADFSGPEDAVVITITDLRAATPMGAGIEVIKGRKRYASTMRPSRPRGHRREDDRPDGRSTQERCLLQHQPLRLEREVHPSSTDGSLASTSERIPCHEMQQQSLDQPSLRATLDSRRAAQAGRTRCAHWWRSFHRQTNL